MKSKTKSLPSEMPFGMMSMTEQCACQREMSQILRGLEGLISIIDDMLVIHGKTQEKHGRTLKDVLQKLGGAGATLNTEKFQFSMNKAVCARYVVNGDGIKSNPEKTEFI